jgi:hypothetical protein
LALLVAATLPACVLASPAEAKSTPDQWLFFQLVGDEAWPPRVDADGDSLFVIPFRILKADGDCSDTIEAAETRIMYDSDMLTLVSVQVDSIGWPHQMTYHELTQGDTDYVELIFTDSLGVGVAACSDFATFAVLTFKPICRAEAGSSQVAFLQGTNLNVVVYDVGGIFHPSYLYPANAYMPPLEATLSVHDTTFMAATGDTVEIPVYMENNFQGRFFLVHVGYDSDALTYIGASEPVGETYFAWDNYVNDTALRVDVHRYGQALREFNTEDELFIMRFVCTCDLWGNETPVTLLDSTFVSSQCQYIPIEPTLHDGMIFSGDLVHYSAVYSGDKVGYEDLMSWDILLSGTSEAGWLTGSVGDTAGVVVNVNLASHMGYEDMSSLCDEMAWQSTFRDFTKVSLFQVIDTLDNTIGPGDTLPMVQLMAEMRSTPATLPTWANPYIVNVPQFVITNNAAYEDARAPVTVCDGAVPTFRAGLQTWEAFPPAPAALCDFVNEEDLSYRASSESIDIWARANVATEDFAVTVSSGSRFTMNVEQLGAGIDTAIASASTITFSTNGSFAGIAANDSALIARVDIYRVPNPKYGVVLHAYLSYTNREAYRTGGNEIFTSYTQRQIVPVGVDSLVEIEAEDNISKTGLPRVFALHQNYPNPFNPTTTISLDMPAASHWRIEVYNMLGQEVKVFEGYDGPGTVEVQWDASSCATGVYLYRATAGEYIETRKMLLMK